MINVLIVDDERNIRKAFMADIISKPDKYNLVDAISSAGGAEVFCASKKVDLILMDINTENYENGIEASAKIKEKYPQVKIIITTSFADLRTLEQAKQANVDSFWFKEYSDIELLEVMDMTVAGGHYYPREKPDILIGEAKLCEFTPAQLEVLYLLPDYFSNSRIAEKLIISEGTVKVHIRDLCQKTGCKSRAHLISLITRSKLVIPQPIEKE